MKRRVSLLLNICLPLFFGAMIYCLASPDVAFVRYLDEAFGISFPIASAQEIKGIYRVVRNHLPDMLWAYALVFSLVLFLENSRTELKCIACTAAIFSTVMEMLQLVPWVKGTFDVWDIGLELLTEGIAVCVVHQLLTRRNIK